MDLSIIPLSIKVYNLCGDINVVFNHKQFLTDNCDLLLRIFGQVYTARSIELSINNNISEQQLTTEVCLQTIKIFLSNQLEIEFPLPDIANASEEHILLAHDLHSLVICEDCRQNGLFERNGIKYAPKVNLKYKRYANI